MELAEQMDSSAVSTWAGLYWIAIESQDERHGTVWWITHNTFHSVPLLLQVKLVDKKPLLSLWSSTRKNIGLFIQNLGCPLFYVVSSIYTFSVKSQDDVDLCNYVEMSGDVGVSLGHSTMPLDVSVEKKYEVRRCFSHPNPFESWFLPCIMLCLPLGLMRLQAFGGKFCRFLERVSENWWVQRFSS